MGELTRRIHAGLKSKGLMPPERPVVSHRSPDPSAIQIGDGVAWQVDRTRSIPYGEFYFQEYQRRAGTEIGERLNAARVSLVKRYASKILDVGIGCGAFLDALMLPKLGYDVNPRAVDWLKRSVLFCDPYKTFPNVDGVTLWDVLEHLPEPGEFLRLIPDGVYLFVSLPIFEDLNTVRQSKHFKPDEHYWYFTERGLVSLMSQHGLHLVESNDDETRAGREGIKSYVFRKGRRLPAIDKGQPLTVRTMNGIGDLCWAMALIANAKEVLDIPDIVVDVHLAGDFRDNRVLGMLERLSFIDHVRSSRFPFRKRPEIVDNCVNYVESGYNADRTVYYLLPNGMLEWGQRLETLLPEVPVDWDFLKTRYAPYVARHGLAKSGTLLGRQITSYICLHLGAESDNAVCGMNIGGVWSLGHWCELVARIRTESDLPIYVLGAPYDAPYAKKFLDLADRHGLKGITDLCGKTCCAEVIEILRGAGLLVSFASGIPISAVYLGTPTLCFWNPQGRSMSPSGAPYWFGDGFATSWVPPNARYAAAVYTRDDCESVFKKMCALLK